MSDPEGADTHYRDPRYYDHAYSRYKPDVAFYASLGERSSGPVLELGVGTGRVAMALADRGVHVVGVDRMPGMLERCRERLAKKPRRIRDRIELFEGDMRTLFLERRFALVIAPFNVFQHLYTRSDVEQALAMCRAHLEPDGLLAMDVLVPDPMSLARNPNRWFKCRPIRRPGEGRRYLYEEAFEYDHERQIQITSMRFTDPEDSQRRFVDTLPQRQFFPRELESLLHYNGFTVELHDGGFEREPIDAFAESQVIVARLSGR